MLNNNYTTVEEVEALSDHIGKTLSRLLDVLEMQHIISATDRKYVAGVMNRDDWVKEVTKDPIESFTDMLFGSLSKSSEDTTGDKDDEVE